MRILLVGLMILVLGTTAYSQDPEMTLGHPITREDILRLPPNSAPRLTLQQALKIAERFVKKENLDVSSGYLFEAKWVADEPNSKEGAWRFWWITTNSTSGKDIKIMVSMDGKARRFPSMGAT